MHHAKSIGCRTCPFRGMNDAGTEACRSSQVRRVNDGQVLQCTDVRAATVFVLRTGSAKVSQHGVGGQKHILQLLGPGDVWNVESLRDETNPSALTALQPAEVCCVPSEVIRRLLVGDGTVPIRLVAKVQDLLRDSHAHRTCQGTYRAAGKVACLLLQQAERTPDGHVAWRRHLTHAEMGEFLGTSGETVCRALANLRRRGAVDWDADWVYLLNRQVLDACQQESFTSAVPAADPGA